MNFERYYTGLKGSSDRGWHMVAFVNTGRVLHSAVLGKLNSKSSPVDLQLSCVLVLFAERARGWQVLQFGLLELSG